MCILIAFLLQNKAMFLFFRQNTFTNNLQILHLFNDYGKEHYKNNTQNVTLHTCFIILPINHIII